MNNSRYHRTPSISLRRLFAASPLAYVLALALAAAACFARYQLGPFFGAGVAYVTFYPAVMLAATVGGFGPGAAATSLSACLAYYLVLPPVWQFSAKGVPALVGLAIFVVMGFFISLVAGLYHRSREWASSVEKELAVRESQERFHTLADNIAPLVWMADGKGQRFWYNKRWFDYTGTTPEEMEGSGWLKVHHPAHTERVLKSLNHCFHNGVPCELTLPLKGRDGNYRWFLSHATPIRDEQEKIIRWFGTNTDITDRIRAEETVHRQNALLGGINRIFREALSSRTDEELAQAYLAVAGEVTGSAFGFIGEIGADGLLHDVAISDPGWEACTMYDQTGHRRPPGNFKIVGLYGRVLRDGKPLLTNTPSAHPDTIGTPEGHPLLDSFLGVPLVRGGNTVGIVAVANREGGYSEHELAALEGLAPVIDEALSHRRAREAVKSAREELEMRVEERTRELQAAQERLIRQSSILEGFFTSTITPLVLLDKKFNFIRVNQAYARACQKEVWDFPGRNHFEFYPHEENEAIFRNVVEAKAPYHATAKPFSYPDHPEWGTTYWEWSLTPLLDVSGEVEFLVFSLEDVTERVRAEQQLRQSQKLEALGTLAGGIAHDFNNILAAIIGFAEMVDEHLPHETREKRHVKRILEAGIRGRDLVRQMLTFSRRTEEEKKKALRLSSIVKETAKLLRASTPTTINIVLTMKSESGVILGDPVQIQQVLMNLATNAAYAMRETGGVLNIELSDFSVSRSNGNPYGIEPGAYMKLVVRDTGSGMQHDIMDKIFDPFFTTKRQGEGTGLGLSVVMGIVKQSRGYITVDSEPDKGSTFTVYFPKVKEQPIIAAGDKEEIPRGTETILFIDDEEPLAEMGEELLGELGYKVVCRTSSREALALFRQDPCRFDLIITDQTMPDLTGIDLAREALTIRPQMPIIIATGFSHLIDAPRAKAEGIREFVMKPLSRREIAKTVRKVLDEREQSGDLW